MNIGWIGTGIMGGAMMCHLLQEGHRVYAYNRTKEKALAYEKDGAVICDTIKDCVEQAEVIFTMVAYPKDVEEVFQMIFANAKAGSIAVDMTTSSPTLAMHLYEQGKEKHIHVLDAPVSGGDSGAKAGTLSIMIGGDPDAFKQVSQLLEVMGTPHYMGRAGAGQHTKACNQICVAGAVSALSEAIHYARVNRLDEKKMLEAIAKGAAGSWQIDHTAPRILTKDFKPGFFIKHFIKDMHIIQEVMNDHAEHLQMLDSVCGIYEELAKQGYENDGTQSLIRYYEDQKK